MASERAPRAVRRERRPTTISWRHRHPMDDDRVSLDVLDDHDRPAVRRDCEDGPRPCPWVACRYHLFLDVDPKSGSIKLNWPDRAVDEIGETCALDVARYGGLSLDEVGEMMNLTRERVRQIEVNGIQKVTWGLRGAWKAGTT